MNCRERNFELIIDISAYNDADVSFTKPIQMFRKHILPSEFTPKEGSAISVPLKAGTGKMEDSSKEGLQGITYTVTLTWDVERVDESVYTTLMNLKTAHKHLIVTTFGGNRSLIRSTEDGWVFRYEESGGVIKCELSVLNVSGVQRVLE